MRDTRVMRKGIARGRKRGWQMQIGLTRSSVSKTKLSLRFFQPVSMFDHICISN